MVTSSRNHLRSSESPRTKARRRAPRERILRVEELESRVVLSGASVTVPLDPALDQFGDQIPTVQAISAKSGTLTARVDADTAVLTLASGHGITDADTVDVYWDGGHRNSVTVAAYDVATITVDAGTGDDFPAEDTTITCGSSSFGANSFADFGIFDTGASVVTFSADFQYLAEFLGDPIPIKNPGGALAEGIGGWIQGDVSQPGTILVDGMNAMSLTFDESGFPVFEITLGTTGAATPGIQTFVGTYDGSPGLVSITGTPFLNASPAHPDGLAAFVDMRGYVMDFSDLIPGLTLAMPDIRFVSPGTPPTATAETTAGVYVPLGFFGFDNHLDPGNQITESYNPVQSQVQLANITTGLSLENQNFLFDTGAQLSVISTAAAQALGFDLASPETTIDVSGVGGTVNVPGFTLSELALPTTDGGHVTFTDVPVYVLDIGYGIDGILGMNLFNTAASVVYDPFHPSGPSLGLTFYTDPDRGLGELDPATLELLQGLGLTFAAATVGHRLPGFSIDTTSPTVTIDQAAGQADPTKGAEIRFAAEFSEWASGFDWSDVVLGGTARATEVTVNPAGDGIHYEVVVSGMQQSGTVIADIRPGAASDAADNPSLASTSSDNEVRYDVTTPTVIVTDSGGVYNGSPFTVTDALVTGVAPDDVIAQFGDASLSYTYFLGTTPLSGAPKNLGDYTVVAHYTSDNPAYTDADSPPVAFTVTPASLTASVTVGNKVYDGTVAATIASRSLGGVIGSDDVSLTGGTAAFVDKSVGSGKTVTASGLTLAGVDAGNYTATATANVTADITPLGLTVSALGVDKVYDGTTAATVTLSDNRVQGDSVIDRFTDATFAQKNAGSSLAVSVVGISIGGGDAGNYTLLNTTATTTANINAATLTATVRAKSKTYNGTPAATVSGTLKGVIGKDKVSLASAALFTDKNVGQKKTVTGLSLKGSGAANYKLSSTPAATTARITPAPLTVTADKKTKLYGQTDPALTYRISKGTVFSGDSFSGLLSRVAGENVGVYAIQKGTLSADNNYAMTFKGSTLKVTKDGTAVVLASSANPCAVGQSVTFHVIVSASSPVNNGLVSGTPTGTVQFFIDKKKFGVPVRLSADGSATSASISWAKVGTHRITASYLGDANFTGSTSPVLVETVNLSEAASTSASTYHANDAALLDVLFLSTNARKTARPNRIAQQAVDYLMSDE